MVALVTPTVYKTKPCNQYQSPFIIDREHPDIFNTCHVPPALEEMMTETCSCHCLGAQSDHTSDKPKS